VKSLVLGCAQWGQGYGVTNSRGRLDDADLAAIIAVAHANDVRDIDTAPGYGDAQQRLRPWAREFSISTKVKGAEPDSVASSLRESMAALDLPAVAGCLIHDWATLDDDQATAAAGVLEQARADGLVGRVGVSAYDEADLERARRLFTRLDAVQVPLSPVDRRLDESPVVRQLAASGTVFEARSVFLQGLLLTPSTTPQGRHPVIVAFHEHCREMGRTPVEVCLGHARAVPWVSRIVVGVTSGLELAELAAAWSETPAQLVDPSWGTDDLSLIDPRRW